jgi:hypothetical protein
VCVLSNAIHQQGVGKGVVGFAAAPVAGALQAVSLVTESIDATTK